MGYSCAEQLNMLRGGVVSGAAYRAFAFIVNWPTIHQVQQRRYLCERQVRMRLQMYCELDDVGPAGPDYECGLTEGFFEIGTSELY
jgi:hypothetical protein